MTRGSHTHEHLKYFRFNQDQFRELKFTCRWEKEIRRIAKRAWSVNTQNSWWIQARHPKRIKWHHGPDIWSTEGFRNSFFDNKHCVLQKTTVNVQFMHRQWITEERYCDAAISCRPATPTSVPYFWDPKKKNYNLDPKQNPQGARPFLGQCHSHERGVTYRLRAHRKQEHDKYQLKFLYPGHNAIARL